MLMRLEGTRLGDYEVRGVIGKGGMGIVYEAFQQTRLDTYGKPPLDAALTILYQISAALDFAHDKGIVHRDMKPSNILFDERDNAYLADFSIATSIEATRLTGKGEILGTPLYMAPEQFENPTSDPRSDVYSFAALAYELLTGTTPFTGRAVYELAMKHKEGEIPAPSTSNPSIPVAYDKIILKGLAKQAKSRYKSAGQLTQNLQRVTPFKPPLDTIDGTQAPQPPKRTQTRPAPFRYVARAKRHRQPCPPYQHAYAQSLISERDLTRGSRSVRYA